jgi:hypothetical protein
MGNLVRARFRPFLHKEAAQGLLFVHGKGMKLWTLGLKGEIVSIASLFFFFEKIMQERYLKW